MSDHDWPVVESRTEYETGWYAGGYDRVEQPDGSTKNYYWADLPPAVVVVAVDDGDVVFVDQYRPTIREQCLELVAGIVERVAERSEATERASGDSGAASDERSEATERASGDSGAASDERSEATERASGDAASRDESAGGRSPGDGADEVAPEPDRESYVAAGRRELREEAGYAADDVQFVEEFWTATGVLRHRRGIVFADGLTAVERELDDNEFLSVERVPVGDALSVAREPPANDATIEGLLLARADGYL